MGVFQLIIGIILLTFIKLGYLTEPDINQPFNQGDNAEMNIFAFALNYVKLSYECIFYVKGPDDYPSIEEYNKFQNDGECSHSIWYIIGYTLSLFIVQYNIGSIMHHRFLRYVQYLYALMVPITFLAFLAAMPILNNAHVNTQYSPFDVAGLLMVALGVFIYNFTKEKPQ